MQSVESSCYKECWSLCWICNCKWCFKIFASATLLTTVTQYQLCWRLGGSQDWSEQVRKISPPQGCDTRTVQLAVTGCTACAIPAHDGNRNDKFYICQSNFMFLIFSAHDLHEAMSADTVSSYFLNLCPAFPLFQLPPLSFSSTPSRSRKSVLKTSTWYFKINIY